MTRPGRLVPILLAIAFLVFAPQARAEGLDHAGWERFKSHFISNGRVIDDHGERSHSEGQGYAMLLAVAHDDRATFSQLLDWTNGHLKRDDGLYSWAWKNGRIEDPNNATDGDMLIAWALLRAGKWDREYFHQGLAIVAQIRDRLVVRRQDGYFILPGLEGFQSGTELAINPSYWVYPALREFARYDDEAFWNEVIETGLRVVNKGASGPWHMTPDWISWPSGKPWDGRDPLSSYDALRIPLYLIWGGYRTHDIDSWSRFWTATNRSWLNLSTNEMAPYAPQSEHLAISMLTRRLNGERSLSPSNLPMGGSETGYYSSIVTLLVQLAWSERF